MAHLFGPCENCGEPAIAFIRKAAADMESPLDQLVLVSICAGCMRDYLLLIEARERQP